VTAFIIVCVAMLLAACLWLVLPLLRGPRTDGAASDSAELSSYRKERRLSGVMVALLVPILAIVMYAGLSNWDWKAVQMQASQAADLEQAIKGLEAKLAENPDNLDGWFMLGRSYMHMERYPRAVDAFQQAYNLSKGENVEVLVALGEALALTDEASLTGRARQLFDTALSIAPNHPKALWYGGIAALRTGDLRQGRDRFEQLIAQNPPPEVRNVLERQIQDLNEQLGEGGAAAVSGASAAESKPAPAAGDSRAIQVTVSLAPQLRQQVSGTLPLFVLARDPSAGGPPLAVQRHSSADLPLNVTLTESDAMIPARSIATVPKVVVVARLSRSGAPQQQSGDLYGEAEYEFGKSSGPVTIVIDRVVP
jgi:cytochrome c-type biogenesis protein CcmH